MAWQRDGNFLSSHKNQQLFAKSSVKETIVPKLSLNTTC